MLLLLLYESLLGLLTVEYMASDVTQLLEDVLFKKDLLEEMYENEVFEISSKSKEDVVVEVVTVVVVIEEMLLDAGLSYNEL